MKLFIKGLPADMNHRDLKEMFELYATILAAKVVIDPATRRSKGFGFVEFASAQEAKETIALLNGKTIDGRPLIVQPAETRTGAE